VHSCTLTQRTQLSHHFTLKTFAPQLLILPRSHNLIDVTGLEDGEMTELALALEEEVHLPIAGHDDPQLQWIAAHRLPLFSASDLAIELELCRLLAAQSDRISGFSSMVHFAQYMQSSKGTVTLQIWMDAASYWWVGV
jgi:hypothetical protein